MVLQYSTGVRLYWDLTASLQYCNVAFILVYRSWTHLLDSGSHSGSVADPIAAVEAWRTH